jgi:hypothetical protein
LVGVTLETLDEELDLSSGAQRGNSRVRVAVIDRDSGFMQVLAKRFAGVGFDHRMLSSPVNADALVAMRLSALVVDLDVLAPAGWEYLRR